MGGWRCGRDPGDESDAADEQDVVGAEPRQPDAIGEPVITLAEAQDIVATKTAPRITEGSIKAAIASSEYVRLRHLTICVLTLRNGFFVTGVSAPAAPENYDQAVGERYAYDNAFRQIWQLEGYRLRCELAAA